MFHFLLLAYLLLCLPAKVDSIIKSQMPSLMDVIYLLRVSIKLEMEATYMHTRTDLTPLKLILANVIN